MAILATFRAVDKTRIGPTNLDWIGSDSKNADRVEFYLKKNLIYSVKVGAYQIPIKNGQVVFLDQDNDCTVFAYSSPFCLEDFLFLVIDLHSVNYFMKIMFFF